MSKECREEYYVAAITVLIPKYGHRSNHRNIIRTATFYMEYAPA